MEGEDADYTELARVLLKWEKAETNMKAQKSDLVSVELKREWS